MAATETNCEKNANGEWIASDGQRVRVWGRMDGWSVAIVTYENGTMVRREIVERGISHELALRIAGRIRNEIRTSA